MNFFSLENKVVVITGGSSGIGLATTQRFVKAGAQVIVAARTETTERGAGFIPTDVSDENQVKDLMVKVNGDYGRIDILINNAGIGIGGVPIVDSDNSQFEEQIKVNAMGVAYGIKHAAEYIPDGGAIVNVASLAGLIGFPTYGGYCASKAAVIGISKVAALELAPRNIRVNCVCPGTIDTPMMDAPDVQAEKELVKVATPLRRMGKPEEVAALIHFLSSDDCQYITGESIIIDGGWNAGPSFGLIESVLGSLG